jgi:seryl-tRNA synthetase
MDNAIKLFDSLGLHFRVVNVCTGDMGTCAAKKYDLEAWMPVQKTYREMVSCSNMTDYQTRRLNVRYRAHDGNKIVHTLNSTAIATTRALVAIIENFQDSEGNIHIPKILHQYMNGVEVIKGTK